MVTGEVGAEVSCALHDTFLHTLPYARSLPSWSENGSCRSVLSGTTIRCISDCTEIPIYGYVSTHVRIYEGTYVHVPSHMYTHIYVHTYTRDPGCPGKNGEDATWSCHVFGTSGNQTRFSRQFLAVLFHPDGYDRAPNRIHFSV